MVCSIHGPCISICRLWQREGPTFEPVCEESAACIAGYSRWPALAPMGSCKCSGYSNGGPLLPNLEVIDMVKIPVGTKPGKCKDLDAPFTREPPPPPPPGTRTSNPLVSASAPLL